MKLPRWIALLLDLPEKHDRCSCGTDCPTNRRIDLLEAADVYARTGSL